MVTRSGLGDWWSLAACRAADPELFFPVSGVGHGACEVSRAKAICARCAIRQRCLEYALETRQPDGIWGGASEAERRQIVARRRRLEPQVS
jgi:WhiB family transcriptional regulator, redox-sensing transcriptional regulator